jgi:hypothetical protein
VAELEHNVSRRLARDQFPFFLGRRSIGWKRTADGSPPDSSPPNSLVCIFADSLRRVAQSLRIIRGAGKPHELLIQTNPGEALKATQLTLSVHGRAAEVVQLVALRRGRQSRHYFFADLQRPDPRVCGMSAPRMRRSVRENDSWSMG